MSETVKKRNANIELLRIISILMISMLHVLGKGNALNDFFPGGSANTYVAWILEALSISAVNIFFLISGYFLIKSEFKLKRLVELILQTVFYTVLGLIIGLLAGFVRGDEVNTYYILNTILPVHMDIYWFVTVYVVIYILSPVISIGVNNISKKQFETVLMLLVAYECLFKSLLPVSLMADASGYSLTWGITVFLTGAYIRLYGIPVINKAWKGCVLFLASCVLLFIEDVVIKYIHYSTGHFTEILEISYDYNHLFVYTAAIGLFMAFLIKPAISGVMERVILALSPMTLGVYLIQENLPVRYEWMKWFGVNASVEGSLIIFVARVILAVICIFIIGTVVDYVRILLFRLIKMR